MPWSAASPPRPCDLEPITPSGIPSGRRTPLVTSSSWDSFFSIFSTTSRIIMSAEKTTTISAKETAEAPSSVQALETVRTLLKQSENSSARRPLSTIALTSSGVIRTSQSLSSTFS